MVEDYLWIDLFTSNIIGYCIFVCIVIAVLRGAGIISKDLGFLGGYVYLIKALVYAGVVVLLVSYFVVVKDAIETLNIFTGFTFLFSSIEVIDNMMLFGESLCDKKLYAKDVKKILRKQERDMEEMISILSNIHASIEPGRVKNTAKQYFNEFRKLRLKANFSQIDLILEKSEKDKSFSRMIAMIATDDVTIKILRQADKKKRVAISFDKKECQRFCGLLKNTIDYMTTYYDEKLKLKNDTKRMELFQN